MNEHAKLCLSKIPLTSPCLYTVSCLLSVPTYLQVLLEKETSAFTTSHHKCEDYSLYITFSVSRWNEKEIWRLIPVMQIPLSGTLPTAHPQNALTFAECKNIGIVLIH